MMPLTHPMEYCEPNAEEFGAKMRQLYENPDLAKKLGQNGREKAKNGWLYSQIAADLVADLKGLL